MKKQQRIIGLGSVVILVATVWFGISRLPSATEEKELLPPSLSNISADYVTSTSEVVISWSVDNIEISEFNTGVRYDATSHSTSTATSESYPGVQFPTKTNTGFEARIKVGDEDEFFYRIQVSHNNEFLWSDEGVVLILEQAL